MLWTLPRVACQLLISWACWSLLHLQPKIHSRAQLWRKHLQTYLYFVERLSQKPPAQCPTVLADLLLLICTVKFPTGTITQNSDAVNSRSGKQRRAEHGRVLLSALSYVFSCLLPALALRRSGHILYPSHLLSLTWYYLCPASFLPLLTCHISLKAQW